MDLFNVVLRKFKQCYFRQEQLRKFTTYDMFEDGQEAKIRDEGVTRTFKKEANWLPYIMLIPEVDGKQLKSFTKLKQKYFIDELLSIQSKFLHLEAGDKVLYFLREHSKVTTDMNPIQGVSVTTSRKGRDSSYIWNNLFNYSLKG